MHETRPIRLLVVTPRYLPLTGGVEHHVREVSTRLERDFDVTVLTTDTSGSLPREETLDGLRVLRVPAWPRDRDYRLAPSLPRVVAEGGWDVVHVQSYHTAVAPMAMRAALRAGIPFVVTFHGGGHSSAVRNLLRGPQRAALRPLLARAERLIAVAEFEAAFFSRKLRIPRERFAVIPNGSDLPAVGRPGLGRDGDGKRVIASIGRLERYKGHQHVIAAMPAVLEQEPDVELEVIGSGPYRERLEGLAARLGVAERVTVRSIPASDRAAMASAMAACSLVVSMSAFETHPLAVIEAVALGTPALVADTSGLRELADRGLAARVPPRSGPGPLASAIVAELRDPHRPPAVSPPTWDECAADVAEVYRAVSRRGPSDAPATAVVPREA